ncbi:MAG TPA: PAC2 family protein, partial [Phycisphaerales bacterium]|nr:PAC2 family protein [Phycisphaerales bacterium]
MADEMAKENAQETEAETESGKKKETWLVAAWPGMGNVGVIATGYMVVKLEAGLTLELPVQDLFESPHVEVSDGLARPGQLPRCMFFEWKNPNPEGKDLLLFIGEAQPASGGYSLCRRVMEHAMSKGVSRVFTFAAMASQMHPTADARAFGVTSDPQLLAGLRASGVTMLKDGQISGLNGVLLSAALEKNIGGICLMGELPFYAAGV